MSLIQILFLTLFLGTSTLVVCENSTEPQYMQYIDSETNESRVIDLRAPPDRSVLTRAGADSNAYFLYTRHNPERAQRLIYNNRDSILQSYFNPADQTVVIVHGWLGDRNSPLNPAIKKAFLNDSPVNVIIVDWSDVASHNYVTATLGVSAEGRGLGSFLQYLRAVGGASFDNMHLIGFSLGAHVVGYAGKYLSGQVARITGLDPAGPLWESNSNRLKASDAMYVEAIRTNRNFLGSNTPSGDVDFYPNGGSNQPGCFPLTSCSHQRSWQLFAATVTYDHLVGRRCDSDFAFGFNSCFGYPLRMGNKDLYKYGAYNGLCALGESPSCTESRRRVHVESNGRYRLKTGRQFPYPQVW